MTEVLERERKWEVDEDFVLPSLDDIVPGGEVEHSTIELTSAYFDTADRDLSAHGLLLRRREGDDDAGWQLKMPDSNGRIEIRYPSADTMPSDLSALLTGVNLGKQLVNVATIHTTRKRYRITDPTSHQLVAEIADDHVCATVDEGGTGEPIRWREVEVELGPAADEVPRKLAKRLASAGAKPVLGKLQDTVVARNTLLRLATKAGTTPGENGFTYGLLYANELRQGEAARREARHLA